MNLHTKFSENMYLNVSNICDHYGQYMYDSSHNILNPMFLRIHFINKLAFALFVDLLNVDGK